MIKKARHLSYGRQSVDEKDISVVCSVLRSDWLTQGPEVERFESALCQKLNAGYAAAVANGTAALHLTGLALGWQPGDIVITAPLTFLATANCILYAGARPDFCDIDPLSYTLDPNQVEERVKAHQKKGQKVKAVIGVDYAGHPCDWSALRDLADQYGFQLVADACHALGAAYDGDTGYALKYADIAVYSFHPVKHITTGEGGAVLTNHRAVDETIRRLRTHGMTKDPALLRENHGPWYYEMHELGYNYRITDMQCALGNRQLAKLDDFLVKRRTIARYYDQAFAEDQRLIPPKVREDVLHAYHLYPLRIRFDRLNMNKKTLFAGLKAKDIFCQVHYIPIHLQPYYQKHFGFNNGDYPISEEFYAQELSIPMHPRLCQADLDHIVQAITEAAG